MVEKVKKRLRINGWFEDLSLLCEASVDEMNTATQTRTSRLIQQSRATFPSIFSIPPFPLLPLLSPPTLVRSFTALSTLVAIVRYEDIFYATIPSHSASRA